MFMDTLVYSVNDGKLCINYACLNRKNGVRKYNHLIKRYKHIEFFGMNNSHNTETMSNVLTKNTSHVKYNLRYEGPINLSKNIIHVCVGASFRQLIVPTKKLIHMHFDVDSSFNNPIDLSKNLKEMHFGKFFNQLLYLPKWIQCLRISYAGKYNKSFILTKYLKNIVLCIGFTHKIDFFDGLELEYVRVVSYNDYVLENLPEKIRSVYLMEDSLNEKPIIQTKTNIPRKCVVTSVLSF